MLNFFQWAGHVVFVASLAALIAASILKQPLAQGYKETTAFKTIEPFGVFHLEGGK